MMNVELKILKKAVANNFVSRQHAWYSERPYFPVGASKCELANRIV
jgi:hypothetical protein